MLFPSYTEFREKGKRSFYKESLRLGLTERINRLNFMSGDNQGIIYRNYWNDINQIKISVLLSERIVDFISGYPQAYRIVLRRKLEDYIRLLLSSYGAKVQRRRISDEELRATAEQYNTKSDFMRGSNSQYVIANRRGILDEIGGHFTSPIRVSDCIYLWLIT